MGKKLGVECVKLKRLLYLGTVYYTRLSIQACRHPIIIVICMHANWFYYTDMVLFSLPSSSNYSLLMNAEF